MIGSNGPQLFNHLLCQRPDITRLARERELAARLAEAREQPPPIRAAAAPARGAWPPAAMPHKPEAWPVPPGTGHAAARQVPVCPGKFRVWRNRPTPDDGSR